MDSILESIKKLLGIDTSYDVFDADLIIHINSVLSALTQIGVGPKKGFSISDSSSEWSEFIDDESQLELVKSYVYIRTKLLFDPPMSSAVMESYKRIADEYEWRISVIVNPGSDLS